jgi:hypothetical protein
MMFICLCELGIFVVSNFTSHTQNPAVIILKQHALVFYIWVELVFIDLVVIQLVRFIGRGQRELRLDRMSVWFKSDSGSVFVTLISYILFIYAV